MSSRIYKQPENKIFLVSVNPDQSETHMIWEGHTNLEEAKKEFAEMRTLSFNSLINPLDGYVYEGTEAAYGNVAVKLDVEAFSQHAKAWARKQVVKK
jgi:hypothetical protein